MRLFSKKAPFVETGGLYDPRREVTEGSGALAELGYNWDNAVKLLWDDMVRAAPELRQRNVVWVVLARRQGFRIQFFDDDGAILKKLQDLAANPLNPQVHAGRIGWL